MNNWITDRWLNQLTKDCLSICVADLLNVTDWLMDWLILSDWLTDTDSTIQTDHVE